MFLLLLTPGTTKNEENKRKNVHFFRDPFFGGFWGAFLEPFGEPLGALGGALGGLGGSRGALGEALGALWDALGTAWESLGDSLGLFGALWVTFWSPSGCGGSIFDDFCVF